MTYRVSQSLNSTTALSIKHLIQKQVSSPNKADEGEGALPPGWERHEDSEGAYYWHVKSGTIQRERPMPHTGRADDEMEAAAARSV